MNEEQVKAVKAIAEAAELLGWQIVFNQDEDINYILIVNPEVADEIIEKLEK